MVSANHASSNSALVHLHRSILVNGSEKPNIHSQNRSQCFVSMNRQLKNTEILLEAVCSLSIAHVISIERVIGRLRVSVHWRVTKSTFFGRYLFFSDNHLSNYTKTIIRLRLSKYWWVFPSTSSRGIFTNIFFRLRRIIVKYFGAF